MKIKNDKIFGCKTDYKKLTNKDFFYLNNKTDGDLSDTAKISAFRVNDKSIKTVEYKKSIFDQVKEFFEYITGMQ